jgi:hypothetical protein
MISLLICPEPEIHCRTRNQSNKPTQCYVSNACHMSSRSSTDCSRIPHTRTSQVQRRWRITIFTPPSRTFHRRRLRYVRPPSTSWCIPHWSWRSRPSGWRTHRAFLGLSSTSEAAYYTAQQAQDYEATNPCSKSDDERFILVNPANYLTANS